MATPIDQSESSEMDHVRRPSYSQIKLGELFIEWAPKFEIYSDYCNNFCLAQHELGRLEKLDSFSSLAETCRKSRGLIDLKVADFLLVPIQRICKYKILFQDLIKNTKASHPDYKYCKDALVEIENITQKINDSKKKFEETINVNNFQLNIKNWIGADLSERSFRQIYSGHLDRIGQFDGHSDSVEREVTLFDNQMVICYLNDENEKMLEERIDLNHVTIIFDNELNRIKIECHFKKYSKVIELRAENETSFNIWRQYIQFELQFNDPNQNKENANHHILGDKCSRTKLRHQNSHRRSPRNSIGHIFETIRRKKPESKTL